MKCRMCGLKAQELDGSGVCNDCNYDDQADESCEECEVEDGNSNTSECEVADAGNGD